MKKLLESLTAVTALLLAAPLLACDYPERAQIPNGSTATRDEMIAGQQSVKAFITAMEEYLRCIEGAEADVKASEDIDDEEKASRVAALIKKYNAAVDDMNIVAAQYNDEVKAYRDQPGGDGD